MNRKKYYKLITLAIVILSLIGCSKKDPQSMIKKVEKLGYSKEIQSQESKKRILSQSCLQLIQKIELDRLDVPITYASDIENDPQGNVYILDFKYVRIHKISSNDGYKTFNQKVFGNGRGQGPGEFTRITDFKVREDKVYIANKGSLSILIYSTEGKYLREVHINHEKKKPIYKFTFYKTGFLAWSNYKPGNIFHILNSNGEVEKSFGDFIDKSVPWSVLYHDSSISAPISDDTFYFFPYYLGYAVKYRGDKFLFCKETIDGLKTPLPKIKKMVDKSIVISLGKKRFSTVQTNAINSEFILIKASDRHKKISYWDLYTVDDFDYILTLRVNPWSYDYTFFKNYLFVVDKDYLSVYKTELLFKEARKIVSNKTKSQSE
jgi:hypothetical protein